MFFKQNDNRNPNWSYYKVSAHNIFALYGNTDAIGIPCLAFYFRSIDFTQCVLPTCMSAHHLCAWGPRRPKHPIRSPGTGIEEGYGHSMWALGTQPGFFKMTVSSVNCRATYPGPVTYSLQNHPAPVQRQNRQAPSLPLPHV